MRCWTPLPLLCVVVGERWETGKAERMFELQTGWWGAKTLNINDMKQESWVSLSPSGLLWPCSDGHKKQVQDLSRFACSACQQRAECPSRERRPNTQTPRTSLLHKHKYFFKFWHWGSCVELHCLRSFSVVCWSDPGKHLNITVDRHLWDSLHRRRFTHLEQVFWRFSQDICSDGTPTRFCTRLLGGKQNTGVSVYPEVWKVPNRRFQISDFYCESSFN